MAIAEQLGHFTSLFGAGFLILGIVIAYIVMGAIVNQRKLASFQGPPLAAYSRLWLFLQTTKSRSHFAQAEALEKYGSPARIGPNLLVTDDVDLLKHVSAPRSGWTRSHWYTANKFDPRQDTVFSTRDEKVHTELKAKEYGAYSGRDIDTLEPEIDKTVLELIELIKTKYNARPLDLAQVARWFTLDVLSRIAFGKVIGNLQANDDVYKYGDAVAGLLPIFEVSQNHPNIHGVLSNSFVQKILKPNDADEVGFGKIVQFARSCVRERFEPGAKCKNDMLGHFVGKGLTELQCEVEAALQILAGSDSTSTVIRNTLFLLVGNPGAYNKLRTEIDTAFGRDRVASQVVPHSETKGLAYLDACIWEGIRMYPPLFGLKIKCAPKGGDTFKGVFYPEGTELGLADAAMCRKKSEWGEDADVFRPERFTEADGQTRQRYETIVASIFGSGKWTCLGKHIAMMELQKVFVELIRNFDWVILDPLRGVDMVGHTTWIQKNMFVIPYPRSS